MIVTVLEINLNDWVRDGHLDLIQLSRAYAEQINTLEQGANVRVHVGNLQPPAALDTDPIIGQYMLGWYRPDRLYQFTSTNVSTVKAWERALHNTEGKTFDR